MGWLSTTLLLKDGQDVFESGVDTVNTQDAEQFAAGAAFLHRWFILEIAHNYQSRFGRLICPHVATLASLPLVSSWTAISLQGLSSYPSASAVLPWGRE
jgi:hypothetical protein